MKRSEFIKSLVFAPAAFIPKDIPPENDSCPVKEFRYMTQRGTPWVMFMKRGNPKPCWFYWCFPYGVRRGDYQFPNVRNPGKPEELLEGEGWEFFEGVNPEIRVWTINEFFRKNFPDTNVISGQMHIEWLREEKLRKEKHG